MINKDFVVFRTQGELGLDLNDTKNGGILSHTEWEDKESYNRIYDESWSQRYNYEASIISNIIKENNFKKILELGPGPGMLCNKITKQCSDLEYHLVDIEAARLANEKEKLGGTFHVQDLNNDFDISSFNNDFDLIVANDFLEHIQNPALVVSKAKNILQPNGKFFVSVPNWRMGHGWIYRGLFDWDNFIHFMYNQKFKFEGYVPSFLKCSKDSKLDSERTMPDDVLDSWNFYLLFGRYEK